MPLFTTIKRVVSRGGNSLTLRASFLVHLAIAAVIAVALSYATLLVLAAELQHIYDESQAVQGNIPGLIYDANAGTFVASCVQNLSTSGEEYVPVYTPDESGSATIEVNDLVPQYAFFTISGLDGFFFNGDMLMIGEGGATIDGSLRSTRQAMNDYEQLGWEGFVRWLNEEPQDSSAQSYIEALGAVPKTVAEAKSLFAAAFDSSLATPLAFFSASMYAAQDVEAIHKWETGAYLLIVLWFVLSFIVAGNSFYRARLARPLQLLEGASDRIAEKRLDFTVAYGKKDEMGKLADSFEVMRSSLEENLHQLWRAGEEQRQLNAAFAHDLRTPLAVLRGRVEMLTERAEKGSVDSADAAATCEQLLRQVQRLENYVTEMGALQRLEDREVRPELVGAAQLIEELCSHAESLGNEGAVKLEAPGPEELEARKLTVDSPLVFEVIENLVANALRYSKDEVRVRVVLPDGEDYLRIQVSDDGPGFSSEALGRGSEPFFTEERESGHMGVGLAVAAALCRRHGGSLTLENAEQRGALVTASFSCSSAKADAAESAVAP